MTIATSLEDYFARIHTPQVGSPAGTLIRKVLAILPVAHRFESWNFFRISLAGTWTAMQFFAGP